MNKIELIRDIPKIYTALAEWISCVLYIVIIRKNMKFRAKAIVALIGSLIMLIGIQEVIGNVPVILWIPGMLIAVAIMFGLLLVCSGANCITTGYWLVRAFVLAEMAASLEWQISYYITEHFGLNSKSFEFTFMAVVYLLVFAIIYVIESRQEHILEDVTVKELLTTMVIGIVCFCLSNLSYVSINEQI